MLRLRDDRGPRGLQSSKLSFSSSGGNSCDARITFDADQPGLIEFARPDDLTSWRVGARSPLVELGRIDQEKTLYRKAFRRCYFVANPVPTDSI
jgi:hypothetical protein